MYFSDNKIRTDVIKIIADFCLYEEQIESFQNPLLYRKISDVFANIDLK